MTPSVSFFNRIAVRLAALILLLGFLAVPIVSEVKRRLVERLVLQQAEAQAATATLAVANGLQNGLRPIEAIAGYLATDLEGRKLDAAEVERILRDVLAGNPSIAACSLSFEPFAFDPAVEHFGRSVQRTGGGLLTRDLAGPDDKYWTRPWYGDAISRAGLGWSEPLSDQGGLDANVVQVSAPFYHTVHGRRMIAGVVAVGVDLAWVRNMLRSFDFFDTGYFIIFSRDGRVLAHPNPAYVLKETMESLAQKLNQPELATIQQRVLGKRQGALAYFSSALNRRVHENYKPAEIAGWGIVVGYSEAEFLSQVSDVRWITIYSLAATLVLLAVIVLAAIQFRLRPLADLTKASDEIGLGNLDSPLPPRRRDDEIGRLTGSFGVMREALKANRVLEAKVREHAAELEAANQQLRADLLERRWGIQALEHQLRYNQLIIDSISEAVLVLTKAMNISRINPAVVHLMGFEAQELVNQPLSRYVRLDLEGNALADPLGQALKAGHDLSDRAATAQDRNGNSVPVRLSLFPLRDGDKVVGGVVVLRGPLPPARASV